MFTTVEEALEYLGDEARKVYEEGADESWELRPEHAGDDQAWYEWCDDCETFHTNRYPIGYEVTQGHVEMVAWCCDQDGNWDVVEGADVGTPEGNALMETYGFEAWERNYAEYLRHVAETGEDPCGEFMPPLPTKVNETWTINVIERGGRVWVMGGSMKGGMSCDFANQLPDHVKSFMLMERVTLHDGVYGSVIDPDYVKSVADLGECKKTQGDHRSIWILEVDIERKVPAMTDEEWAAKLREKANLAVAKMTSRNS